MNDLTDRRIRELVARAGDEAPPMPDFDEICGRVDLVRSTPSGRGSHLVLIGSVAAGLALLIGIILTQRNSGNDQITAGQPPSTGELEGDQLGPSPRSSPAAAGTVEAGAWSESTWAVLPDDVGFVMRYAAEHSDDRQGRWVGYNTSPEGDSFEVTISRQSTASGFEEGRFARSVHVGDVDGVLLVDPSQPSALVTWQRDGFAFSADTDTLDPDELVRLTGLVRPATETELSLPVVSFALDAADRFDVATEELDGETLTLRASTSDGSAFFFWVGGGGGGPTLLAPGAFVDAAATSITGHPPVVYGLLDQAVASLRLRMKDGTERPVEIQSRALGYPVAFFFIPITTFNDLSSIDAYDGDGAILDSFDLEALFA